MSSVSNMSSTREKLQEFGQLLQVFGFLAWLAIPSSFLYYYHLKKISPKTSDDIHSFQFCDHGYYFYSTPNQSMVFHSLLYGGVLFCVVFMLLGKFLVHQGMSNASGNSQTTSESKR
jgi:hypothetical protein